MGMCPLLALSISLLRINMRVAWKHTPCFYWGMYVRSMFTYRCDFMKKQLLREVFPAKSKSVPPPPSGVVAFLWHLELLQLLKLLQKWSLSLFFFFLILFPRVNLRWSKWGVMGQRGVEAEGR